MISSPVDPRTSRAPRTVRTPSRASSIAGWPSRANLRGPSPNHYPLFSLPIIFTGIVRAGGGGGRSRGCTRCSKAAHAERGVAPVASVPAVAAVLANQFGVRTIDISEHSIIVEMSSKTCRVEAFISLVKPFALCLGPLMTARHTCPRPLSGLSQWASRVCIPPQCLSLCPGLQCLGFCSRGSLSHACEFEARPAAPSAGKSVAFCSWQCFPNCGRVCDNDNTSTTPNVTTMMRPRWLR